MTLIVLGIRPDKQEMECISDSRISAPDSAILSDTTAKVIPFTAIATYSVNKPRKKRKEWREDLCFCYAGSTLLSNSVFALGTNICRSIFSSKIATRPSLEVYAEFFRFAFEEVGRDLNYRKPPSGNAGHLEFDAEIAVFGYDKTAKRIRAFVLRQKIDCGQYSVVLEEYPENNVFVALGEKSAFHQKMTEQMLRLRQKGEKLSVLRAFKSIHADNTVRGVGGCIQVCFVDRKGIDIPVTLNLSDHSMKFFGIPCDSKTNYQSKYTIGDISVGAQIRSY